MRDVGRIGDDDPRLDKHAASTDEERHVGTSREEITEACDE